MCLNSGEVRFKQFFDNHELFNALQYYYNKDLYRFEFKSAKYAPILKNSVAFKETASERIFLMKDLAAVEEAVGLGAKIVESEVAFD
jgi:hypothetical protein